MVKVDYKVLRDKDLLFNVIKEIQKRGVIGEEDTLNGHLIAWKQLI